MSKNVKLVWLLLALAVIIIITPLLLIKDSEFGGADGMAEEVITEINPSYEPWFESILVPPGGETESLLFCIQAGAGAAVLGFGFGFLIARNKYKPAENV